MVFLGDCIVSLDYRVCRFNSLLHETSTQKAEVSMKEQEQLSKKYLASFVVTLIGLLLLAIALFAGVPSLFWPGILTGIVGTSFGNAWHPRGPSSSVFFPMRTKDWEELKAKTQPIDTSDEPEV